MTATIPFLPNVTTNASGQFGVTSQGYVQGLALPDAAARNWLRTGVLSTSETLPMVGGVGIYEHIPVAGLDAQGLTVGRATSVAAQNAKQLTGFSVFNQATAYLNSPQSPVPSVGSGGTVAYYRLGTNIRIPVACAPSLVSLDGSISTSLVSWDFTNQQLIPYVAAYPANVLTGASWSAGAVTFTTTSAHGVTVGSYFTISGCTPAGYNGDYVAVSGTTGSTLVAALATNPGAISVEGTLVAGGGALPISGIDDITGNSKTVILNSLGGYSWQTGSTVAIITL